METHLRHETRSYAQASDLHRSPVTRVSFLHCIARMKISFCTISRNQEPYQPYSKFLASYPRSWNLKIGNTQGEKRRLKIDFMSLMIQNSYKGGPCSEKHKDMPTAEESSRQDSVDESGSRPLSWCEPTSTIYLVRISHCGYIMNTYGSGTRNPLCDTWVSFDWNYCLT